MAKSFEFQNSRSSSKSSNHLLNSYIYTRVTKKVRQTNSEIFYSLAPTEKYSFNELAMKRVSSNIKIKLMTNNKDNYLSERYDQRPSEKYNFPQATSWRIGWFNSNDI